MQQIKTEAIENIIIDRTMPAEFTHLVSQAKYDTLIDIVLKYFKDRPGKLKKLENGLLLVDTEDGEMQYSFFNLLRRLLMSDVSCWKPEVHHFFNDRVDISAYRFFFNDYEHARKYLKILIKPADFVQGESTKDAVTMTHLPGTVSCLVLHYENKFMFLLHSLIKEWQVSVEELFEKALENVSRQKLYTRVCRLPGDVAYSVMMSHQYSAPQMLDPEKNIPDLIGKYGTIFSIPANGLVLAAALNEKGDLAKLVKPLFSMTFKGYKEEPSPITYDLFHYHDGHFSSLRDCVKEHLAGMSSKNKKEDI